jgi:hypothetical protein
MEQLIFVGIILLFSILEAVARKSRAQQQGKGELPDLEESVPRPRPQAPRPRPRPEAGSVPHSYDEDASFDESARGDERVARSRQGDLEAARSREGDLEATRARPGEQEPARTGTGSEGLIPDEFWKEIEALARGGGPVPLPKAPERPQPTRVPEPARVEKAPTRARPAATKPAVPRKPASVPATVAEAAPPVEGTPDHPIHLSHAAYGTPVTGRAVAPPIAHAGTRRPAAASAVRALVRGRHSAARDAIILQEVLGPPVGMRE